MSKSQITPPDAHARALKVLNARLWHFTSIGLGNCRAAQNVRREIQLLTEGNQENKGFGQGNNCQGNYSSPRSFRAKADSSDNHSPDSSAGGNPLANQSIEQLTAGLSHLTSVGMANSRAAQKIRRELSRKLVIQSAALANYDPKEPRDHSTGEWTTGGDTNSSATNTPAHTSPVAAVGKAFKWVGKALVAAAADIGDELTGQSRRDDLDAKEAYQQALDAANNDPAIRKKFQEAEDLFQNGKTGADLQEGKKKWDEAVAARDALVDQKFDTNPLKPGPDNVAALLSGQQELPAEGDMKVLPTPLRVTGRAAQGLLESAPKIGAVAALQAGGVPAPLAAGAVFGTTENGFDPKQAIIAAALPFIDEYSGAITKTIVAKTGVSSEVVLQAIKKMGGTAAVTAAIGADQLQQISKLPPEKRKDALIEAAATAAIVLLFSGIVGAGKRDSLGDWVDENGGGLSEKDNIQRGQNAMDRAIRQKTDVQKAMYRKAIGQIDFKWGTPGRKEPDAQGRTYTLGEGISHILAKHPESLGDLPEAIAKGRIVPHETDPNKCYIIYNDELVVLRRQNSQSAYVVTGFDDPPRISELKNKTRPAWLTGK